MGRKDVVFVRATDNYKLLLEFEGGEYRVFDFRKVYANSGPIFKEILSNIELFKTVKLDGTGTICWDNEADIAIEYLYDMSEYVVELNVV